jgi:hypothetical protein
MSNLMDGAADFTSCWAETVLSSFRERAQAAPEGRLAAVCEMGIGSPSVVILCVTKAIELRAIAKKLRLPEECDDTDWSTMTMKALAERTRRSGGFGCYNCNLDPRAHLILCATNLRAIRVLEAVVQGPERPAALSLPHRSGH